MKKIKTRVYECGIAETITFDFISDPLNNVQVLYRFGVGNLLPVSNNTLSFSNQPLLELMFVFKTDTGTCKVGITGSAGGSDKDVPLVQPDMIFPDQRRYHFILI